MRKEYLEALETLKNMLIGNGANDNINDYVDNLILPIKQALQRLEQIDNPNPSEVLEDSDKTEDNIVERNVDCLLHNIENGHFIKCDKCDVNWHKGCMCCIEHLKNSEEINTIKQALIQAEKDKKYIDKLLDESIKDKETIMNLRNENDKLKITKSKKELAWEIAREYKVDLWLVSQCDYENYLRIRKEATVENEMIASDSSDNVEDIIPRDMFELLKECLK